MFEQWAQSRLGRWNPPALRELLWQGGDWLLYGALTPLVFLLARKVPVRRGSLGRSVPIHLLAALGMCGLWAGSGLLLRAVMGLPPMAPTLGKAILSWVLTTLPFGVAVYFAVLGIEHAIYYFGEAKSREMHAARLSAQLADARLGALRAQLNPHFLFNSLNAITVLVRDHDTGTAARALEQLADILRQVLQTDRAAEVTLADEIGFLERYLAIERIRFSDRLRTRFVIDPALRQARVPSLVLQPLVENALRHGLARRTEGGEIAVTAERQGNDLVLTVRNDGPPLDAAAASGAGLGIPNTRERLATMYGDRGRLTLNNVPGGVQAEVRLPYNEAAHG